MRGAVGGQTEQTVITIYPQLPASIVSWHHHGSLSSPSLSPKQTFPIFSMLWNLMASCQAHNSLLAESLLSYASGKWKPMDRKSLNLLQPWLQTYLLMSQWPALLEDAPPSTSLIYHLCWELHLFPGISLYWPFPLSCIYFKLSFFTGSFLSAAKPALLQIVLWPLNLKANKIFLKGEEEVTSMRYQQFIVWVQTIKQSNHLLLSFTK